MSMLNWRRDPGYEQRMKQLANEIERSKERTKQFEKDTELIEKEIKQLRQETARLKALNASVRQLCFPPESSSIPPPPTAPDCKLSSP
jgi:septal ring factor EnvC (AmiA/AmiB activator)